MIRDHIRRTDVFAQFEPIQITIDESAAHPTDKKTVELMPLFHAAKNAIAPYTGSQKIAAIKAVRAALESQGFFVGLGDAKLFVEQFIPLRSADR